VSTRIDYTAEEWNAISAAPQAARLFMAMASSAELNAGIGLSTAIAPDSSTATVPEVPELIRTVLNGICVGVPGPMPADGSSKDRVKDALLNTVKTAVRAVEHRSPAEVEPFKAWLACVAAKASRTSQEQSGLMDGGRRGEAEGVQLLADVLAVSTVIARTSTPSPGQAAARATPLSRSPSYASRVRDVPSLSPR